MIFCWISCKLHAIPGVDVGMSHVFIEILHHLKGTILLLELRWHPDCDYFKSRALLCQLKPEALVYLKPKFVVLPLTACLAVHIKQGPVGGLLLPRVNSQEDATRIWFGSCRRN